MLDVHCFYSSEKWMPYGSETDAVDCRQVNSKIMKIKIKSLNFERHENFSPESVGIASQSRFLFFALALADFNAPFLTLWTALDWWF